MATPNRNDKSPNGLRREVARSRQQLGRDVERFRDELDFPKKIRRSFQRQPGIWITGLAVAGVAVVLLLTRRKTVVSHPNGAPAHKSGLLQASFMLGALRIVANLVKPHVETFLSQKMRGYSSTAREK